MRSGCLFPTNYPANRLSFTTMRNTQKPQVIRFRTPVEFFAPYPLAFSSSTLPVPSCHATRSLHEGWDTARLTKPRQGKSRGGGQIRTTNLPVMVQSQEQSLASFSSVSSCHATWRKHKGWSIARSSRGRGRIRTKDLPVSLGNPAIFQPSCLLRVAWQLRTERVVKLNDEHCQLKVFSINFRTLQPIWNRIILW
ncbi:hypothetical protein T265_09790 [Opisthorchis viverrini]|uniref:Uncharacterized protein n=1 Tax=Opisthorchis viverrini TaxID=6198 RepID=A0A074ZFM8_OPIVI|nr:hypothetical protein T265_09790 [Opisthorchis viverrini]KER22040.1 hypothetical protein T265_09790 [Opisthorchis viverrini]